MMDGFLSNLGLGILLAWLALPLFARLAAQSRQASPASYHRALLLALVLGSTLFAAPWLHESASAFAGHWFASPRELSLDPLSVVSGWVVPLIGPSRIAWPSSPLSRALSALALVWLLAVTLGMARLFLAHWSLLRLCRKARPAPEEARQRAGEIAAELGVSVPRLLVSDAVPLPFTAGIVVPVVVLTAEEVDASPAQLDFVLRHELSHVARGDARIAWAVSLARVAFPLHPTARRLAAEIAFAREASVDARAGAASPLEYARFLLASAERMRAGGGAWLVAVSMADTALSRRIDMLVAPVSQKSRSLRTFISLGASGLAVATLLSVTPASWGVAAAADTPFKPQLISEGSLPKDAIRKVVREQYPAFRDCYERLPEPRPATHITLHFVIGPDGSVTSGDIAAAEQPALGKCAEPIMRSLHFPAPAAGEVKVTYPIVFGPDAAEQKAAVPEPAEDRSRPGSDVSAPAPASAEADGDVKYKRLSDEVIRGVVKDSYPEFRSCYEQLPGPRPHLFMKLNFTIGISGRVTEGHVDAEANPPLGKCFEQVMFRLVFPKPNGGIVTVGYPIEVADG